MSQETTRLRDFLKGMYHRTLYGGPTNSAAYFVTRFYTVRRAVRWWNRICRRAALDGAAPSTLFSNACPTLIVEDLQRESHAVGIDLSPSIVEEIRTFAETTPCTTYDSYSRKRSVNYLKSDWRDAERELGKPIVMGRIIDSSTRCPAIRRIEHDPLIHEVAEGYLGYPPRYFDSRLYWSFVTDRSNRERAVRGQNVYFHYDLHRSHCNSLFFQFYFTDVDENAGPLRLVRGSHGAKPMRFLFSSANQSEAAVFAHYGQDRLVSLNGPAGFGFVMDGYCMHQATPPATRDRLFLQLRVA